MSNSNFTNDNDVLYAKVKAGVKVGEKKIKKSITKEKKYKAIPINPERLDRILKKIGRKKL